MAITSDHVELVARRVTDDHLTPPNKWDRDVDDRMTREAAAPAVYQAVRELMAAIAGQAAPDESLLDVKHATGYSTAGFSGFKANVLLVVATDHRLWFCRHKQGAIQQLQPLRYSDFTVERKRISFGWPKLEGTTITCGGSTADWLTALQAGRQEPAAWLRPSGPPPGWHADPYRRYQLRYWDGARWSEHVSTNGVAAVDPVGR
ncbi:DUF2510 domain-containing protein [Mycobacterium sp. IDR2000157661]|uniref:DUF2510 domain-containing protein n=1 Tax=Mycobacterium sp. IDR2000157661 TaxID=2867005 RepID=UPI001EEAE5BF|nr:DUF2510 domain-containing protein [Mycobacterium sp. IDR2000157661]ULE34386.1 DUF2510 domain-containing protein [Mycobacterium sp. IDR2000157661]